MFVTALALFFILIFNGPALYAQSGGMVIITTPPSQEPLKSDINDFGLPPPETPLSQEPLIKITITKPAQSLAQLLAQPSSQPNEKRDRAFWNFVNQQVYEDMVKIKEEKRILREKWRAWLGLDVFYPYYKAQEIREWVLDRTRVQIFHLKGRLKFENKQFRYTFSMKF